MVYGWRSHGIWLKVLWYMVEGLVVYGWRSHGIWLKVSWYMVEGFMVYGWRTYCLWLKIPATVPCKRFILTLLWCRVCWESTLFLLARLKMTKMMRRRIAKKNPATKRKAIAKTTMIGSRVNYNDWCVTVHWKFYFNLYFKHWLIRQY